jgi:hypothetical protein
MTSRTGRRDVRDSGEVTYFAVCGSHFSQLHAVSKLDYCSSSDCLIVTKSQSVFMTETLYHQQETDQHVSSALVRPSQPN